MRKLIFNFVFAITAVLSTAQSVKFVVTSGGAYPMRWGETDASSDNIPGCPAIGTPCCFMLGSQTKLVVNDPKVVSWDVISLSLDGQPTKRHYWSVGDTGMMPASQTVTLPAMPSNVDYAWLYYDIVLSYPVQGGGTNTVVEQMGGGYHHDMFFTLPRLRVRSLVLGGTTS